MLNRQYQNFIGCESEFAHAEIIILGAPYDGTTSNRPGARFGSGAIRSESFGLETFSPYQNRDLSDRAIFDAGDLDLPFGESKRAVDIVENASQTVFENDKRLLLLGGEHLVSLGSIRAAAQKYPGLHLIQFDAHADIREDYLGARLSHAAVIRRCHDLLGDGRISQFGIRSGERAEFEWSARGHTSLTRFGFTGLTALVDSLIARNAPVYLTLDLDVLDSSVLPGTGTPEAGGVSWQSLLDAMLDVFRANVVAADIVELAPNLDSSGASTAAACKLVREALLAFG